ncbi:hypothetical protein F4820DRAFT_414949 [Hypoxylon rubiginosum]|uniref:Uncharacterized protein n=1 Tax=Hypoxylon rubiginosum TaxID=110542 RepID=A0ACB9Z7I2_9PEZI|nr:hypothetical protein F4820DRAFT_414949 [Hypoxylon rubiginosum]
MLDCQHFHCIPCLQGNARLALASVLAVHCLPCLQGALVLDCQHFHCIPCLQGNARLALAAVLAVQADAALSSQQMLAATKCCPSQILDEAQSSFDGVLTPIRPTMLNTHDAQGIRAG